MHFFDSHSHLHDTRVKGDLSQMMDRARQAGVVYVASCATMEENFEQTKILAQTYPEIVPHFGIHPWFIDSLSSRWKENLQHYLQTVPSAVGEIGLDFMIKDANRERQLEVFEFQLSLAVEMGRPVNMHNRKAWESLVHVLKRFGPLKVPGLIHSYSGSADMIPVFEKYNLFVSFSGAATNPKAKKVIKSLMAVSENRYVLETDAPDIQPFINGERITCLNEPAYVKDIARIAAERLGKGETQFASQAFKNSLTLFESVLPGKEST